MSYPVWADKVGSRIHVNWTDAGGRWRVRLAEMKTVPGASFMKSLGCWSAPLTMQTCHDLRAAFGQELGVRPALADWARQEMGQLASKRKLQRVSQGAFDAVRLEHVPTLAPRLHQALLNRPYQLPAVAAMAKHPEFGNWDDPGLGKTLDTLGAIVEGNPNGGCFLVTCPATSVHVVWELEIQKWMSDVPGGFEAYAVRGSRAQRTAALAEFQADATSADRAKWMVCIVNHEMLETNVILKGKPLYYCLATKVVAPNRAMAKWFRATHSDVHQVGVAHEYPELFMRTWDGVYADEAHLALVKTGREDTLVRRGYMKLNVRPGGARQPLTGSLLRGKHRNLFGTLNWLYPERFTSFWAFANSYLQVDNNGFGHTFGQVRPEREKAFYELLDSVGIRRTKDELHKLNPAWAPPPRSYYRVTCEMGARQAKLYKAMEDNAAANMQGGTLTANGVLAEMTRLRQFAGAAGTMVGGEFVPSMPSGKFDRMLGKLAELGITEEGGTGKVVIASQFTQLVELFSRELAAKGVPNLMLTGNTAMGKRAKMVQQFMDPNGPRVMFINTKAGGVSITLDIADDVFILDETWIPDDQDQVEGRVHRTSDTKHQVRCWYFVTEGTIEEEIGSVVDERDISQRHAMDGRRGVQFARKQFGAEVKAA